MKNKRGRPKIRDREYMLNYWREYNKTRSGHSKYGMHKIRFGGLRDKVLKRDNYSCVACGMSNQEHFKKWDFNITIDHVDGEGRNSKSPNNNIDNLQTLCIRCHGRKDSIRYWHERSVSI